MAVPPRFSTTFTTGDSPATKYLPFAGGDSARAMSNSGRLRGSVSKPSWATATDFASPPAPSAAWHTVQALSLSCLPPGWLVPAAQSMVSWQEPQASREGFSFQFATCAPAPSWHLVQVAISEGNPAFHQVTIVSLKPQIA